ncbi:MAG: hypothetical protein GXY44_10070 [Phycisphaerales bacterium]|nr:hypothetical protein [Phycisphaerales bacterium]
MSQSYACKRVLLQVIICAGLMLACTPSAFGQRSARRESVRQQVAEQIKAILDQLELDQEYAVAEKTLTNLFDQVIGYGRASESEMFREAGLALRMVRQLGNVDEDQQATLLKFLRANPQLSSNLVFLFQPADEDEAQVYSVLNQLRANRGDQLEKNPTLTAAICVVHDQATGRSPGPGGSPPAGPLEIFDYYTRNEMYFPIRPLARVPAELLVWLVDVNAGIDELAWAAERLGGIPLDELFQRLLSISHQPLAIPPPPSAVGTGPQRLETMLQTGGSDQDRAALVALTGKALGIPNVLVTLEVDKLKYTWVGFLDIRGQRSWWNFTTARLAIPPILYEVGGELVNPQTSRPISIQTITLLAGLLSQNPADQQAAIAMFDGVQRLIKLETLGEVFEPAPLGEGQPGRRAPRPRQPDIRGQLDLLALAIDASNGLYAPAWGTVAELARVGKLDWAQTRRWVELVNRICGRAYPDFTLELVRSMVATVPEVEGQNELWETTFRSFRTIRPDLAADVRISQGEMWEKAGDYTMAMECYRDVVRLYANTGPFIVKALDKAEQLLVRTGQMGAVANLYGEAWEQIAWPPKSEQSVKENTAWFQIGMMYADRLDKSGRSGEARQTRLRLTVY